MSFTAAASGFLVFLLSVSVVQGQDDWGVTYTSTEICALKGSTVDIRCTYRYPAYLDNLTVTVEKTLWFTKTERDEPVNLRTDSEYEGRVEYHGDQKNCSLRIKDLRETDSAVYKFRFITNHPTGSYTASSGVTLTVTDLQVQVTRSSVHQFSDRAKLKCHSNCRLAGHPSYVWYKNGQKIKEETSSYTDYFVPGDSYSCAVKGQEDFRSPSVCVHDQTCNRVTYTERTICALKGSSVDISCTYNSYDNYVKSKFWFSPTHSHRWQHSSQPEDLSGDSEYAGRVQQLEERGLSTLRITDLRESDSAEYRFKFKTPWFEWGSDFPGTTLTVTDPDFHVQVAGPLGFQSYPIKAKLKCHSSCLLAVRPSYIWYKNGQKIKKETSSSYTVKFYPEDSYSCGVKGLKAFRSPSVYAPKVPSVLVSPSGEIVEGSSVTLTCSSDANPAATYTWYKENGNPDYKPFSTEPQQQLAFVSIQSPDSGEYYCEAVNELGGNRSDSISINVKYGPKVPSVLVSPSGETVEGSSVNLTCSSDANPAATYTWYKENEASPKASGQTFTITNFTSEHSGEYYCEARNPLGATNSPTHLIALAGKGTIYITAAIVALIVLILIAVFLLYLWIRKKKTLNSTTEPSDPVQTVQSDSDPEYENLTAAQTEATEEQEDLV
ncbi:Fc receptor-like protein 2 isoform X2 [Centroberyx affinis]|uniref:Fc receptor-like protein 2 isoform X2 n=1 Tax=Centroberyx affinis TaxID=166261 RepID=UPI003A5C0D13